MIEHRFPADFLWGAATASFQVEGALLADGRGQTIWDRFCDTPGRVFEGHTGEPACDHYRRYREDVALMRQLGFRSYRFSVAWARVFPNGGGPLNQSGVDFYSRLVDELLAAGIVPMLTLYHWDLPQALQERGGWPARDTARYFADFAAVMFERLADRVKLWITHNEPFVAAFIGHKTGVHAPGLQDEAAAVQAAHHLLLSHALAVQIYREHRRGDGKIGISLNLHPVVPDSDHPADREAAVLCDAYQNRWFLDPVFRGTYPEDLAEIYARRLGAPRLEAGDPELLAGAGVDFLGVNYYFRHVARRPQGRGELFTTVRPDYPGARFTEMGWEVWPEGLYDLLLRLHADYGQPEMYVTENGAAFPDARVSAGRVQDDDRIDYLRGHFAAAARAMNAGVRLRGYQVWSLMDNFEWAYGYSRRFGLVYVDFKSQKRTPKASALWYREVIAAGGL